ncbi:unnamed protein product [Heligmosomoides polygyrus]|uniref:PITH domain-containing protein n=1 Tax=Heligmosomoides polygyrus TaxID=6339 RepID=A0A183FPT8_HELPZ|nr:unnamed protein product [Heligmosomoides polygyrus]
MPESGDDFLELGWNDTDSELLWNLRNEAADHPSLRYFERATRQGIDGSSAKRRESDDVPQTSSNVRYDSDDVLKMSFNFRQDSKDLLQTSSNVRYDSDDVLKMSLKLRRYPE